MTISTFGCVCFPSKLYKFDYGQSVAFDSHLIELVTDHIIHRFGIP
jgi:hypothetical protein